MHGMANLCLLLASIRPYSAEVRGVASNDCLQLCKRVVAKPSFSVKMCQFLGVQDHLSLRVLSYEIQHFRITIKV
jgi:hypothetical protein